ncbi:MAG TPA: glycosyltransferase family 4 protein [Phycisphaerae bacterium]|nr:glycosyltransferase family 4 protein [Phycisphaerae bacterium]
MKILHIITRLIVGGAQENTLLTCEGLARRGHEVTLLTGPSLGPEGSLMERAQAGGYRVQVTPHLVRNPHAWHDAAAWRSIRQAIRDTGAEVVHTHSSKAGIVGRGAAWGVKRRSKNGRPLVVHTIHGLPFHPYQRAAVNRLWISLERWAAKRCDAIICVADAMTRQALAAGVGRPELFTTVYSGMEVEPFVSPGVTREEVRARLGIPAGAYVFGTIARLQPLKGHDDLLAGAAELFEQVPDAHFLWLGDGVFRARFEQTIRERGWQKRFTLAGLVPPGEVPRLLPAMDALVHPSYREGLARALPQALLGGVPVISYDCDGAAEVCIENQTGYLVKTGDGGALTAAMIRMASHRQSARAMGAQGRTLCLDRFSAERMVERIAGVYERLGGGTA